LTRRSKLELQLDILKALEHGEMTSPTRVMYDVNICWKFLEQHLTYLEKQNLVEKISCEKRSKYAITQRGLGLLRGFKELKKMLQIEEESTVLVAAPDI
jgi:predicted transcriptional regulator